MNKEIHHSGWLIKSPPTKRIWRARWRRRWFTLKQGEIPGQFCLEYYTDRQCRKLKGIIDLDQCEQVDSGLRLEHRKQKFQYMFDIKTPKRTYYLAADTEKDMRDWVNCICQVCNLHDFTKQPGERQYYNLCDNDSQIHVAEASTSISNATLSSPVLGAEANNDDSFSMERKFKSIPDGQKQSTTVTGFDIVKQTEQMSISEGNNSVEYQNSDFQYVNTDESNRETMLCDNSLQRNNNFGAGNALTQWQETLKQLDSQTSKATEGRRGTQENEENITPCYASNKTHVSSTGVIRKIPENLVLTNTNIDENVEPSPSLSTSSGPYIPISECFSGSPKLLQNDSPVTPLNNLDPKFYDTPRSHNNIGLNLTNDKSYSPKIYNCPPQIRPRSGRSSPTDSESVFTDDEEFSNSTIIGEKDRSLRPSDSSVENDAVIFTYTQRFSKLPTNDVKNVKNGENISNNKETKQIPKKSKPCLDSLEEKERVRDINQLSDTENTSPAIGPQDITSCIEESYDIPRSHQPSLFRNSHDQNILPHHERTNSASSNVTISENDPMSAQSIRNPHFYTNAAPSRVEGNVFRYDFMEQSDLPPVNRSLKPKLCLDDKTQCGDRIKLPKPLPHEGDNDKSLNQPPSVDRKLKPNRKSQSESILNSNSSLQRPCLYGNVQNSFDNDFYCLNTREFEENKTLPRPTSNTFASNRNSTCSRTSTMTISPNLQTKSPSQLQYFDLDVANPPMQVANRTIYSNNTLGGAGGGSSSSGINVKLNSSLDIGARAPVKSSVVYNSVDFVKTEAFKRVREDAEKSRMKE